MTLRRYSRIAALFLMVTGTPALADDVRREAVHFAPDTSVTIPSSGNCLVDVYLMRDTARRNETANDTLTLYVE